MDKAKHFTTLLTQSPVDWESDRPENVRAYGVDDQASGNYCYIIVYKAMPGKGSAQADFEFAWENLLKKPFLVKGTLRHLSPVSRQGWLQTGGETSYTENEVTTFTRLLTFSNGKKCRSFAFYRIPLYTRSN